MGERLQFLLFSYRKWAHHIWCDLRGVVPGRPASYEIGADGSVECEHEGIGCCAYCLDRDRRLVKLGDRVVFEPDEAVREGLRQLYNEEGS